MNVAVGNAPALSSLLRAPRTILLHRSNNYTPPCTCLMIS